MGIMIWIGAAISLIGVGLLIYCILATLRAQRSALDEAALKSQLQRLAAVNMGALAVSAIGLMLVIMGIVFSQ